MSNDAASGPPDSRDTWDARYANPDYVFGKAPNAFLARQAPRLARGKRALSVADGEGRNSVWLAEQGLEVTAFDVSPVGIAKARRLAAERGVAVDFNQSDVGAWVWTPERFDVVAAIFVQFADPAKLRAYDEDVDEGPRHKGRSALIDLVAQKR